MNNELRYAHATNFILVNELDKLRQRIKNNRAIWITKENNNYYVNYLSKRYSNQKKLISRVEILAYCKCINISSDEIDGYIEISNYENNKYRVVKINNRSGLVEYYISGLIDCELMYEVFNDLKKSKMIEIYYNEDDYGIDSGEEYDGVNNIEF